MTRIEGFCHRWQGNNEISMAEIEIAIVANDDISLTKNIVNVLKTKGANKIRICYPENSVQVKHFHLILSFFFFWYI